MEGQLLPTQQTSPLIAAEGSKGMTGQYSLASVAPQELPVMTIQGQTALGTPAPDFLSGFTPLAFPMGGYATRQRRFGIRVFLLLGELPSKVDEPHLPEATGLRRQWTAFAPSPVSRNSFAGLSS